MTFSGTTSPHILAQILHMAVGAGLCAGVLAIWRLAWLRSIVVLHAAIVGVLSVVLLTDVTGSAFLYRANLGRWLTLPGDPQAGIGLHALIDETAIVFLIAVSVVALVLALREENDASRSQHAVFLFLTYQTALQLTICADRVLSLGFWQLLSVVNLLWVVSDAATSTTAMTVARRTFLFRFAADAMILLALLPGVNPSVSGLCILGGMLGRCCPFPFFAADRYTGMPRVAVWADRLVVSPLALLLLFRFGQQTGAIVDLKTAMLLAGAGVALPAALTAVAQNGRGHVDVVSLSIIGMMIAGAACANPLGDDGFVILFLSHASLFAVAELAGPKSRRLRNLVGILIGSGLLGTGLIMVAVADHAERSQSLIAWVALSVLGMSQTLVAYAVGRRVRNQTDDSEAPGRRTIGPVILLTTTIGLTVLLSWNWVAVIENSMTFPLVVLLGLIGFTAGWMAYLPVDSSPRPMSGMRNVIAGGWQVDRLFLRVFVAPVAFIAAISRFLDWFLIEFVWSSPALWSRLIKHVDESMEMSSLRRSMTAVLLAAVLTSIVLVWGN